MKLDDPDLSPTTTHPNQVEFNSQVVAGWNGGLLEFPVVNAVPTDTPSSESEVRLVYLPGTGTFYAYFWFKAALAWKGVQLL